MRGLPSIDRVFRGLLAGAVLVSVIAGQMTPVLGGAMANDPKGFREIPWGVKLSDVSALDVFRSGLHIVDYVFKDGPPTYADTPVESVHLSAVDDQFARVTIRYRGEHTHKQVLAFLERTYGAVERIPGQMTRGLNQQYNWRGPETEINLTYEANLDRGFVFIESRTLSPRFHDHITDSAE